MSAEDKNIEEETVPEGEGTENPTEAPEAEAAQTTEASEAEVEVAQPSAEDKLKALEDRLMRQAAEFENFKKRSQTESQNRLKYASIDLVKDLLPGLDNLERAIEHATSQDHDSDALEKFVEGVEMVKKQFYDALKKNHVERFDPLGETFDPNLHEAVGMIASEEYDNDQVAVVMQAGYKQHDRVLRPAMVQVARNS